MECDDVGCDNKVECDQVKWVNEVGCGNDVKKSNERMSRVRVSCTRWWRW